MGALKTTKQQSAVVASEVVAFAEGVPGQFRQDLVNSTLLAQLVASKKVPDRTRIFDWYDSYFDALAQIGWTVQDRGFDIYTQRSDNFEAHEAIIGVLTTVLGAGSPALVIVAGTLRALHSMDDSSPFITLFARESQSANSAHFQISAVEKGPNQEPFVTLVAFGLEAKTQMTQVLFFRAHASNVTLRHCSSKESIDAAVADAVRQPLKLKLAEHAVEYVKTLPDF